jgi:S1-C subfamily serine protease
MCGLFGAGDVVSAQSVREISTEVLRGTVSIRAETASGGLSAGSGFIVDPTGVVVTNLHVVERATRIEVRTAAGDIFEVVGVRAADRRRDLAILQIPGFNLPALRVGDSDRVAPGDSLVVVGNALGVLENSVTTGVVSGVREIDGSRLIQMDAAISPGNSGGPVASSTGEVIGVTVAKARAGESINFAVPVNYARAYFAMPIQPGLASLSSESAPSLFAASAERKFPTRWRSVTSGEIRTVTINGDVMFVENETTAEDRAAGVKSFSQFRKQNDKWIGTTTLSGPCVYESVWDGTRQVNHCDMQVAAELTTVTPERIEGVWHAPPVDARINCRKCEFNKPLASRPGTWIPIDD